MKLGIIGAGMIVKEFVPLLKELEGMEICAVMGRKGHPESATALANEHGIPVVCEDFEGFKEAGVDTVYIATPNVFHFEGSRQAMEEGFNVIVEKPMTTNSKEAKELERISEETGKILIEAITTRYLDAYAKIKEWLPLIGDLKLVESRYTQYSSRYDRFMAGDIAPVFDPAQAGGAMMDLNLYNFQLVVGLFGRPKAVKYYPNIERGIDTSGIAVLDYEGFVAACTAAKDCGGSSGVKFQGNKGTIEIHGQPNCAGDVSLKLYDGTEDYFCGLQMEEFSKRCIPEFESFMRVIDEKDFGFAKSQLETSVLVNEVMTEARYSAGIYFPADEKA